MTSHEGKFQVSRRDFSRLETVGRKMSNILYNLKQQAGYIINIHECDRFEEAQTERDEALGNLLEGLIEDEN